MTVLKYQRANIDLPISLSMFEEVNIFEAHVCYMKNYACRSKRVFHTDARDEAVVGYSMKHKYPCRTRVTREEW